MKPQAILKRIAVPTGDILITQGQHGKLEMLSIGDYGKDVNIKADFLGLARSPSRVRHTKLLPLEEKWVITISTQYGCSMGCRFCDVPKVGPGLNASLDDLVGQVVTGLSLHPEVSKSQRLNIHFARMGEPMFNDDVVDATLVLNRLLPHRIHPVLSTIVPRGLMQDRIHQYLQKWCDIKNRILCGDAGLQLSINSTSDLEREVMFNGSARSLKDIGWLVSDLPVPVGRKYTLNFALGGWKIDPRVLLRYFDPNQWICKLTPLHRTRSVGMKGMMPDGDWVTYAPYEPTEMALKDAGYDVLVFIASKEEDESAITCGNAILSQDSKKQKGKK